MPILEPAELRRIEQRRALVLAETYDPIIADLHRCIDGKRGKELLAAQKLARLAAHGDDEAVQSTHLLHAEPKLPTETTSRTKQRLGMPK